MIKELILISVIIIVSTQLNELGSYNIEPNSTSVSGLSAGK
jgi:hypothetical protein